MTLEININDPVKVKLTDIGISILKERRDRINKTIESHGGKGFGDFELKKDVNGYTTFQHWELMSIFGVHISMGFEQPFETNIVITKYKPITD